MNSPVPMLRRIQVMEGPLTIYTASEQKDVLLSLFPLAHEGELDLSNVAALDRPGFQLFILIHRQSGHGEGLADGCTDGDADADL